MAQDKDNPLNVLISDNSFDKKELAEILRPHLSISKEGGINFSPAFINLSNRDKVIICLLATKAKASLFEKKLDRVGPTEIAETAVMPIGSVKPTLTDLLSKKEVAKDKDGYFIPNHHLSFIKNKLNEKNDRN